MKNLVRFDTDEYLNSTKHRTNQCVAWIDGTIKNQKREETLVVQQAFIYSRAFLITVSRVNSILSASSKPLKKDTKLILLKDIGYIYEDAISRVLGPKVLASSEKLTSKAFSMHGSKVTMEHLHHLAYQKLHLVPDEAEALHEVSSLGLSVWIVSGALPSYLLFTDKVHEGQK
jgi:hypothetical protein